MTTGVYPGTFNPPTTGHLAIISAALIQCSLTTLDLVVSRRPLAKAAADRPTLEHRVDVLTESVAHLDGVRVVVTDLQLIADIADGYDVVVMGADKWTQVNDPRFYLDATHRDQAIARLPRLAIAARPTEEGIVIPPAAALHLETPIAHISSTAARAGASELMTPAARDFDARSGAWSDPDRYERWARGDA